MYVLASDKKQLKVGYIPHTQSNILIQKSTDNCISNAKHCDLSSN